MTEFSLSVKTRKVSFKNGPTTVPSRSSQPNSTIQHKKEVNHQVLGLLNAMQIPADYFKMVQAKVDGHFQKELLCLRLALKEIRT